MRIRPRLIVYYEPIYTLIRHQRKSYLTLAGRSAAAVFMIAISSTVTISQSEKPLFWRGVYLFGLAQPLDSRTFFTHLSDSLHLNIFQVRTFGYQVGKERNDFFLKNPKHLKVINNSLVLASLSEISDASGLDRHMGSIQLETKALAKYSNHYRFYLADEPSIDKLDAFALVSRELKRITSRGRSVTALLVEHERFAKAAELSELLVETYFLKNNTPHPSLVNLDEISANAGIVAWGDSGYGWYLGGLQQNINIELANLVRPAAEVSLKSGGKVSLIFVPQLHGLLDSSTKKYDRDIDLNSTLSLRPPSPSEIRLQYNMGIAYGAKGFLAFPYGYDAGYKRMAEVVPGLVSGDPSQVNHSSNFDMLFGKRIWTGYKEKWIEVARMNMRLQSLESTLLSLAWVGAKSWTMEPRGWQLLEVACGNWTNIVTACSVRTFSGYHDDLPQVEIGHLRKGKTDYIVVVNRRCANEDKAQITLTLSKPKSPKGGLWKVFNIERRSWLTVTKDQTFTDRFEPGEGKIYRLAWFPY